MTSGSPHPASGRLRWSELRHSVFAKLVVIMVAMAFSLLIVVGGFFWFILGPNLHHSIDGLLEEHLRSLAASAPDLAAAKQISARLNIAVRYEGPAGHWSTGYLPSVTEVRGGQASKGNLLLQRNYLLVPAPDGGTYLFAWRLGSRLNELHNDLLGLLLFVMAMVVLTAYVVLKRLLAPLRVLNEGVVRLSAGELDVELPHRTRDEFGRLTDAFNRMVARVRAMIGQRDQLLTDVSHELRSPLTRLRVALELLPESRQRAGMAADIAEMEKMIAELLELERLRSGRGLQIARHDLWPLLRDAVAAFADLPPGVRLNATPSELAVEIDPEKIRTVLRNLLENAAKYARPESRPVEITVAATERTVEVRVADDGPGIPAADMAHVFEPFYRADRSRSKATGGYGLGLSICKRIMQAHGGDIVLDQTAPRGATFVLILPKTQT